MLGDKLTPTEKIAIQCAAHSADMSTFAACTIGSLAINELKLCASNGFRVGTEHCFGPNNDLRKFARNVLGEEDNIGKVLGAPIDMSLLPARVVGKDLARLQSDLQRVEERRILTMQKIGVDVSKEAAQRQKEVKDTRVKVITVARRLVR
jgi:hypothetical protein